MRWEGFTASTALGTLVFWTRYQWQVQDSELPSNNTAKCQKGRAPTAREMRDTSVRNANGQELCWTSANQRSPHPGMITQEGTHEKNIGIIQGNVPGIRYLDGYTK